MKRRLLPAFRLSRRVVLILAFILLTLVIAYDVFFQLVTSLDHVREAEANYDNSPARESGQFVTAKQANSDDWKRMQKTIQSAGFNVSLSDRISLQRRIPDVRHASCLQQTYTLSVTSVSVVVVFHNEPLSTLLRTIWSVINRTRPTFLLEIILVDDGSNNPELYDGIEAALNFKAKSFSISIIRFPENRGLIKARLAGATAAKGKVLVFLDSHCEVNVGWLEPLLQLIQADLKTFACPIVDTISAETLAYEPIEGFRATGLFSWSMYFTWGRRPDRDIYAGSEWKPFRTATFPGGLFAVDRTWFFEVGSYDELMDGWGGENLEMSFRVWMCGGSIIFVPCSRVGHLSRDQGSTDQTTSNERNIVRLAEVWLDEYSRHFYMARPDLRGLEVGNFESRKALRRKLECRDFKWYLETVCSSKTVPDRLVQAWGTIQHRESRLCLTSTGFDEHEAFPFDMRKCAGIESTGYMLQLFSLGLDGYLRREEWCLDAGSLTTDGNIAVRSYHCDEETTGKWSHHPNSTLRNVSAGKCLKTDGSTAVFLADCLAQSAMQEWTFEHEL